MIITLQSNRRQDFEEKVIGLYCIINHIPHKFFTKVSDVRDYSEECIPVGTTVWVEQCTGWNIAPDYYPDFLSDWVGRKVWQTDTWPLGQKVFIKPADKHKRFNGRITDGSYRGKKKGPYWCSEIVQFIDEWRYYIVDGKVIHTGWYIGSTDEDKPAPDLKISWPKGYAGAVDFGRTIDGRILLVEAHQPYACGWYGRLNDYNIYGQWILEGWTYLKRRYFTINEEKNG